MKKYARYYKECMGVDYNGKKTYREGIFVKSGGEKKLLDIEKVEEELGIDLITLFHLFKGRNVYFRCPHREGIFCDTPYVNLDGMRRGKYFFEASATFVTDSHSYSFKDYGKTWALTREELEIKEK